MKKILIVVLLVGVLTAVISGTYQRSSWSVYAAGSDVGNSETSSTSGNDLLQTTDEINTLLEANKLRLQLFDAYNKALCDCTHFLETAMNLVVQAAGAWASGLVQSTVVTTLFGNGPISSVLDDVQSAIDLINFPEDIKEALSWRQDGTTCLKDESNSLRDVLRGYTLSNFCELAFSNCPLGGLCTATGQKGWIAGYLDLLHAENATLQNLKNSTSDKDSSFLRGLLRDILIKEKGYLESHGFIEAVTKLVQEIQTEQFKHCGFFEYGGEFLGCMYPNLLADLISDDIYITAQLTPYIRQSEIVITPQRLRIEDDVSITITIRRPVIRYQGLPGPATIDFWVVAPDKGNTWKIGSSGVDMGSETEDCQVIVKVKDFLVGQDPGVYTLEVHLLENGEEITIGRKSIEVRSRNTTNHNPTPAQGTQDFYVYVDWNPDVGYVTGINGFVDTKGYLGDPGEEYIFFTGGPYCEGAHTAYIYKVETAGDPDKHPDNPNASGPISKRKFTLVSSHDMGSYASGHDNAFYIDDTGIYYGASDNSYGGVPGWGTVKNCGILHWDFGWRNETCVVSVPAPAAAQTLARNPNTGDWWVGLRNRELYKWNGSSWAYQFTYPNLGGDHHDGLEIVGNYLYVSDMTSDKIIVYRLDPSGNVIDPPDKPCATYSYSAAPPVEGMGFGPNNHIWITGWDSYSIYELGEFPNSPPTAAFTLLPSSGYTDTVFNFDASNSSDLEDDRSGKELQARWDWESDGVWDTEYTTTQIDSHRYSTPGTYTVTLEVKDSGELIGEAKKQVTVQTMLPRCARIVLEGDCVAPPETEKFTIKALNIPDPGLKGLIMNLAYDPAVIHIDEIRGISLLSIKSSRINNEVGKVRVVATVEATTLTGNVDLFELTVSGVGDAGDHTDVTITFDEFRDPNDKEICQNCEEDMGICICEPLCKLKGDVNLNETISVIDLATLADHLLDPTQYPLTTTQKACADVAEKCSVLSSIDVAQLADYLLDPTVITLNCGKKIALPDKWAVYTNSNTVTALFFDGSGVWIGTRGGLMHSTDGGGSWSLLTVGDNLPTNEITDIFKYNGQYYLGTWGGGLVHGNGTTFNFVDGVRHSDWINHICTFNGDIFLSKYHGIQWLSENDSTFYPLDGIIQKGAEYNGELWFASFWQGLYVYNGENWRHVIVESSDLPSNELNSLTVVDGELWIASRNAGIAIWNGNSFTEINTSNSNIPSNDVREIATDGTNVWIATGNGVAHFDGANWTTYDLSNSSLSTNDFDVISVAPNGEIWAGSDGDGVFVWDGSKWRQIYYPTVIPYYYVRYLEPALGSMWAATAHRGLARYRRGTWTTYNSQNSPMINDYINGMSSNSDYLAILGHGAVYFVSKTGWVVRTFTDLGMDANRETSISLGQDNIAYVGTPRGLYSGRVGSTEWTKHVFFNGIKIQEVLNCPLGIFVAGEDHVYWSSNGSSWSTFHPAQMVHAANMHEMRYENGSVYFCLLDEGLFVWDGGQLTDITPPAGPFARKAYTVTHDAEGDTWFGNYWGIYHEVPGKGEWDDVAPSPMAVEATTLPQELEYWNGAVWYCGPGGVWIIGGIPGIPGT